MARLVVCCDGTWNRPDRGGSPTNVWKLRCAVAEVAPDGTPQHAHYEAGVGTAPLERLSGGLFGFGISHRIRDAYRFVVERYAPGDELFVLGFSRGAYAARSLAGLVRNAGILRADEAGRVDAAYRLYRSRAADDHPDGARAVAFRREHAHPEAPIAFVGVWDTVGALGVPGLPRFAARRLWGFHDTTLGRTVVRGHHALAIDEARRPFAPTLWRRAVPVPGQTLEQVWFAGVHSDVGGGYADPSLAEIPLLWMADRARAAGLAFRPDHFVRRDPGTLGGAVAGAAAPARDREARDRGAVVAPDPDGALHDSATGVFGLPGPGRLLRRRRTLVDPAGTANASAASTALARRGYDPANLAAFEATRGPVTPIDVAASPAPRVPADAG